MQQNPVSLARLAWHKGHQTSPLRRMRKLSRVPFCALVVLVSAQVGAQVVPARVVDRRLRIETSHADTVTGRVVRVSADSIVLRDERRDVLVAIAQRDVVGAAVASGLPLGRSIQRGALIGAGLGVVVLAAGVVADSKGDGEVVGPTSLLFTAPAAVLLTLLGTAVGAWSSGESWTVLAPMRVGACIRMGRTATVGLQLSF
jgi:hypothetical protein